ncbi:MAG: universal stress protein [Planctomycetes bacterium]|nr:universal stress protein [Planctomycetota bacterium]
MIERIVVPLDGSLTAEAILPQVRRVLYRNDSEIILVRAVVPPPVEQSAMIAEAELGAAREYLVGQLERLEKSGVRVKQVARIGSPVGVILDVVEEQKATLIALATHGSTGLKRLLFGSVAEGVLRKSPVPVLLLRPFWSYELAPTGRPEQRPLRNILLPVDGSDIALQGLSGLVEVADLFESRIVLLRVLEDKKKKPVTSDDKAEAAKQLGAIAKSIEKKGVETLSLVEKGDPVKQILDAVRFHEIDLVAMTTHGRSGLSRAVTGSVTEEVLRKATVPLLVTRTTAPAKAARLPAAKVRK